MGDYYNSSACYGENTHEITVTNQFLFSGDLRDSSNKKRKELDKIFLTLHRTQVVLSFEKFIIGRSFKLNGKIASLFQSFCLKEEPFMALH